MLKEWANNYAFSRNSKNDFYSFLSANEFEEKLKLFCNNENIKFALSAFSASNYYAPVVRNQKSSAYISGSLETIATQLDLKKG